MQEVLLLKSGELVLKGLNRSRFEEQLLKTVRRRLSPLGLYDITASQSTIFVEPKDNAPIGPAWDVVTRVFGVASVSRAVVCQKDMDDLKAVGGAYLAEALRGARTFRVVSRRADKRFPLTSPQISAELGAHLIALYPHLKARMDDPDVTVFAEVRDVAAYVSAGKAPGAGGLPGGTSGKALLLLSGGIDSPVAGYMMAKRGLSLECVHFHSPPYTSGQALDKVFELAARLSLFAGRIAVHCVPFTAVQEAIGKSCHEDYLTIVTRRMMMRAARHVAGQFGCDALVTGECLAQVASQTVEALHVTNALCSLPVFRPVIGMDKEEIVTFARKIGTYETSVLPFEDCCTVFTPRHPVTRPRLSAVEFEERGLDVDGLIAQAVEGVQTHIFDHGERVRQSFGGKKATR